jgi:glucose-6-phosphate-specific signal transduction histidine kinase
MAKKTLLPNDLRDFLSIISFIGFVAIFFEFGLGNAFLSELMTPVFLIVGGAGLMVIGKVFTINRWLRDGLQKNEVTQLFSVVFGLSAMIIGILMLTAITLSDRIVGFVGFIALAPAALIFVDYIAKNN